MLIETYDLTGKLQRATYQAKDKDNDRDTAELVERTRLWDLLVKPRRGKNRMPYLQNPEAPNLEDFWDAEEQTYSFTNAYALPAILWKLSPTLDYKRKYQQADSGGAADAVNAANAKFTREDFNKYQDLLKDYFFALRRTCRRSEKIDKYIITIPDNYDARLQESILRNALPRERTLLLWRSVAAILGAEELLPACGVKSGDKVAVVDIQERTLNVSILDVEQENGYFVPVRQVYKESSTHYPEYKFIGVKLVKDDNANQMLKGSFRMRDNKILPLWYGKDNGWSMVETKGRQLKGKQLSDFFNFQDTQTNVRCCIVCSAFPISDDLKQKFTQVHHEIIFENPDQNFILDGAAKYAVRLKYDLPTYYDECECLSIVGENKKTEHIEASVLIEAKARCRGGEKICSYGKFEYFISSSRSAVDFYLLTGPTNQRDTKLKKFHQEFPLTQKRQTLTMKASIVPGQGLVQVEVEGKPLLEETVMLDMLNNMEDSNDTIASLEKELKRSFPPDIPDVIPSKRKWNSIKDEVINFLDGKTDLKGAWFAKAGKPTDMEWRDIKAQYQFDDDDKWNRIFVRTNVFGSANGGGKPDYMDDDTYRSIIAKLGKLADSKGKNDKEGKNNKELVRLIAWSYQKNSAEFKKLKEEILQDVASAAKNERAIRQQYKTFCTNMLQTPNEFWRFSEAYSKLLEKKIEKAKDGWVKGVDDWNRAMANMLMTNNDMLKFSNKDEKEADELCENIVKRVMVVLESYLIKDDTKLNPYKLPHLVARCLCIILYMLRRRNFQSTNSFMRLYDSDKKNNIHPLRIKFGEIGQRYKNRYGTDNYVDQLISVIEEFMDGNGTTGRLPIGAITADAYGNDD